MSAPSPPADPVTYPRVLCGLLLLALLGCNRGLWTPDEPREAEISREMSLSPGVIPTLNGQTFMEKPPLYYWVVAAVYRITGGPSALAARAVSVAAGTATLLLLLQWGCSAHSRSAGLIAAAMLATSLQFVISTHWVLIDPLLMLSTTAAAWAAWELIARRDSAWGRLTLYGALVLALWIKGLIGPALIGAGLLVYVAIDGPATWRRLRPWSGLALLSVAALLLGLAILSQGGRAALWDWAYANQVQRLISPLGSTGHRQPLLYYAWTLPYALLPWLLPLLDALRPIHWRRSEPRSIGAFCGVPAAASAAPPDAARYGALMSAGMLLLLSLSATKRETYLLPVLPPLFLWLGIGALEWWRRWQRALARGLGAGWWLQVALLCLYCLLPSLAAWLWAGTATAPIIIALLTALLAVAGLLRSSARGQRRRAASWAMIAAFAGNAILLALAAPLLNDTKDMGPFVTALGQRLPPGQAVHAVNMDETLAAEIPFYTGRQLLPVDAAALRSPARRAELPSWLLVQDYHDGSPVVLPPEYRLVASRSFGPRRSLMLWQVPDRATPP